MGARLLSQCKFLSSAVMSVPVHVLNLMKGAIIHVSFFGIFYIYDFSKMCPLFYVYWFILYSDL